jgi:hypothetical protein
MAMIFLRGKKPEKFWVPTPARIHLMTKLYQRTWTKRQEWERRRAWIHDLWTNALIPVPQEELNAFSVPTVRVVPSGFRQELPVPPDVCDCPYWAHEFESAIPIP